MRFTRSCLTFLIWKEQNYKVHHKYLRYFKLSMNPWRRVDQRSKRLISSYAKLSHCTYVFIRVTVTQVSPFNSYCKNLWNLLVEKKHFLGKMPAWLNHEAVLAFRLYFSMWTLQLTLEQDGDSSVMPLKDQLFTYPFISPSSLLLLCLLQV